jgi:hypothetical protein
MPQFFHRQIIATYARYIVRHGLFTRWEIDHKTMTLKRHKVAQLRRVELTSSQLIVGRDEGDTTVIRRWKRSFHSVDRDSCSTRTLCIPNLYSLCWTCNST